jgi:hypothetical protein
MRLRYQFKPDDTRDLSVENLLRQMAASSYFTLKHFDSTPHGRK